MTNKIVEEHVEKLHTNVVMVTPSHPPREESETFRRSKQKLREDGNYRCFICNKTDDIQVHHLAVEWSEQELADLDKVKQFVEIFDPYGYGKSMYNVPLKSIEDCRCLLCLCSEHHTGIDNANGGTATGIHNTPFPQFIMQKLAKVNPIPQENETIEFVEKRVKEYIDKELSDEKNK